MTFDQGLPFLGKLPVGFSLESGVESMFGLEGSVFAWGHCPSGLRSGHRQGAQDPGSPPRDGARTPALSNAES